MKSHPSAPDAAAELMNQLGGLARSMKAIRHLLGPGLSGADAAAGSVLLAIGCGGDRVTDLAERCHLDLSTTSRHVTALTRLGMVERKPDESDRRAQLVVVTPQGQTVIDDMRARRARLIEAVVAEWDIDDVRRFGADVQRFASAVERHSSEQLPSIDSKETA